MQIEENHSFPVQNSKAHSRLRQAIETQDHEAINKYYREGFIEVSEAILQDSFETLNAYLLNNFVYACVHFLPLEALSSYTNPLLIFVSRILTHRTIINTPAIVPLELLNGRNLQDPLFYNTLQLAEKLQEPLFSREEYLYHEEHPPRNGTFIPPEILLEYFQNAIDDSANKEERLVHLVNFYRISDLSLPTAIHWRLIEITNFDYVLGSDLSRALEDYEQDRQEREGFEEDSEDERGSYPPHNAHTEQTEKFFESMGLSLICKTLDRKTALAFLTKCINNHTKNAYLTEVFNLFVERILNAENHSAEASLIKAASLIHKTINEKPMLEKEIISLFLRYFIFENFIANSTEKLTDNEVNALYHEMNSWSIPYIFQPHCNIFSHSCVPGMSNRVSDFHTRLNALIEGCNMTEKRDYSDEVDLAVEEGVSNIFQPVQFQHISPYLEVEKSKNALADYAAHVIKPRNQKKFKKKMINKEYRHAVWEKPKSIKREICFLHTISHHDLSPALKERLQNVNSEDGACWIRAVMQDHETEANILRHNASQLIQTQLENQNVQNALLDGIASLILETSSLSSDIMAKRTFQNFINGISENGETRPFLDFLRTLSLPLQIEAFSDAVRNEAYIQHFLSRPEVLSSYVREQFQKTDTWGSEADVRALAHARKRNLRIYTRSNQNGWDLVTGYAEDPLEIFYDQHHYQILKQLQSA